MNLQNHVYSNDVLHRASWHPHPMKSPSVLALDLCFSTIVPRKLFLTGLSAQSHIVSSITFTYYDIVVSETMLSHPCLSLDGQSATAKSFELTCQPPSISPHPFQVSFTFFSPRVASCIILDSGLDSLFCLGGNEAR